MYITVNRASVCMGDDVLDHKIKINLPDDASYEDLYNELKKLIPDFPLELAGFRKYFNNKNKTKIIKEYSTTKNQELLFQKPLCTEVGHFFAYLSLLRFWSYSPNLFVFEHNYGHVLSV